MQLWSTDEGCLRDLVSMLALHLWTTFGKKKPRPRILPAYRIIGLSFLHGSVSRKPKTRPEAEPKFPPRNTPPKHQEVTRRPRTVEYEDKTRRRLSRRIHQTVAVPSPVEAVGRAERQIQPSPWHAPHVLDLQDY